MSDTTTVVRDAIIADAHNVPSLLAKAKDEDPQFYATLTGGSMAPKFVAPVTSVISGLAAHYGLGWDSDTCTAIAGVVLFVGTWAYHKWLAPKV